MQLVDGITLEDASPGMVVEEKYKFCIQLYNILERVATTETDPSYPFIRTISHVLKIWAKILTRLLGSVDGHRIGDNIFQTKYPGGTFTDVASFSEWLANSFERKVWTLRNILTHGAAGS